LTPPLIVDVHVNLTTTVDVIDSPSTRRRSRSR